MLPRKVFENLLTVVAILVLFEQILGKFCLNFLPLGLILSVAPNIRASNRLKYLSGLSSGSAKFFFSGLAPVQVFRRLILKVQFRLKLKII